MPDEEISRGDNENGAEAQVPMAQDEVSEPSHPQSFGTFTKGVDDGGGPEPSMVSQQRMAAQRPRLLPRMISQLRTLIRGRRTPPPGGA